MPGEFAAVVERDRSHRRFETAHLVDDRRRHFCFRLGLQRATHHETGLAFHQRQQYALRVLAKHRIRFPVTELLAIQHMSQALADIDPIADVGYAGRFAVAAATTLVFAQKQRLEILGVFEHHEVEQLIYPNSRQTHTGWGSMTDDVRRFAFPEAIANVIKVSPRHFARLSRGVFTTFSNAYLRDCAFVRTLLGAMSFQFSRDGRGVHAHHPRNGSLRQAT